MNARQTRGLLGVNNVLEYADTCSEALLDEIQGIIDNPDMDIPDEVPSKQNIERIIKLLAYYSNQHSFLVTLWGRLRLESDRKDTHRIAARDFLELAISSCGKRYECVSRLITAYQEMKNDK
jgi:hypothetical protein